MARLLPFLVCLAIAGGAFWFAAVVLVNLLNGSRAAIATGMAGLRRANAARIERKERQRLEYESKQDEIARLEQRRIKRAEQEQIEGFRSRFPGQIIGLPDLNRLETIIEEVDAAITAANCYRPEFIPRYDDRFLRTEFSFPFQFFFPRSNTADDGPDPEAWETTVDSLAAQDDRQQLSFRALKPIYDGLASTCEFPANKPIVSYDRSPAPILPRMTLSEWSLKLIAADGTEIDTTSDMLARVYAPEIEQIKQIRHKAEFLWTKIKHKLAETEEAFDMMELFLANETLKFKELRKTIDQQYSTAKSQFEQQAIGQLRPLRAVYKNYLIDADNGIEEHFTLALSTARLPLPEGYPWRVFYDRSERLVQINQRYLLPQT